MNGKTSVLLIDDDSELLAILQRKLELKGFRVVGVEDGYSAIERANGHRFAVAVVDLMMPGLSGLETIRRLKEVSPETEIVVLTANPSVDSAIGALREHIFDYLQKPQDLGRLHEVALKAASQARQLANGHEEDAHSPPVFDCRSVDSPELLSGLDRPTPLIGSSPALARIRELIAKVAPTSLTVLIRGETGTGKEVVARNIHAASGRAAQGAFTKINCPAVPEHLLESEMFGHEKGAFTGAMTLRIGRFEQAAGGTILLDEIGAMSMAAQSKLLEAVEQKEFSRLGGQGKIRAAARILAATNAPLEEMAERGQFRSDLIYRLQQFRIVIPPLREHKEDIPELIQHLLGKYAVRFGKQIPALPAPLMLRLCTFDWPGNVRQLDAVLAQYCVTENTDVILETIHSCAPPDGRPSDHFLEKCEVNAIRAALAQTSGNQRRAAAMLGISYSALRRRIVKYGAELCRT